MTATKKRTDIMMVCFLLVLLLGCACTRELDLERGNGKGLSFAVSTEPWQGGVFVRTKSPGAEGIPVTLTDITDDAGNVSYMLETMEGVPVQPNHTLGRMGSAGTKGERKSEWANNDQFGLRAYVTGGGYDTDYDYFGQTRFAQLTDLHWRVLGDSVYWPRSGNTIRFYAWWPCDASYDADDKSLSYIVPSTPANQHDLLYAVTEPLNVSGYHGLVSLTFKHALTAVAFRCVGDHDVAIKSVKITNVWCKGTFDMDSETWTLDQTDPEHDRKDIVFDAYHRYSAGDGTWKHSDDSGLSWVPDSPQVDTVLLSDGVGSEGLLMLLPQEMQDGDNTHQKQAIITLIDNTTLTIDLPASPAWVAGTTVIYTLQKGGELSHIDSAVAFLGDNENHTGVSINTMYGDMSDILDIDAWRYVDRGDGTLVKRRSKWKATEITGAQSGTITLDGNPVSVSETYGIKGFVRPGQTYEDCNNLWSNSNNAEEVDGDPYKYYVYLGYAAPEQASRRSTKEVMDAALQAKSQVGDENDDYDLSGGRGSNCYIVGAQGYYKFLAVRGSGQTNDVVTANRIELSYIEDNPGHIIQPGTLSYTQKQGSLPYISFQTPKGSQFQQGNAIITATNEHGETVLWQWHIWATDSDYWRPSEMVAIHDNAANTYKFHPVSLGLCYNGFHQEFAQHSITVRVVTTDDNFIELAGRSAASATLTIIRKPMPIEEGYYYMGYRWGDAVPSSVIGFDGGKYPVSDISRFPLPAFTNTNLVENPNRASAYSYKAWNDAATSYMTDPNSAVELESKAKFDPSPSGWHLPPAQATNYLSITNHGRGNVHFYDYSLDGEGSSTNNLYLFTQDEGGSPLPDPIAFWLKDDWYYWSSSKHVNSDKAYGSHKTATGSFFPEPYGIDNSGLVRPVKDPDQD